MFVDNPEVSFLQDLSKPSLRALSYMLRHKELWPVGFKWYFGSCKSCAMGLANVLWTTEPPFPSIFDEFDYRWNTIRDNFPTDFVQDVFYGSKFEGGYMGDHIEVLYKGITPEIIADEIDNYIKERGE